MLSIISREESVDSISSVDLAIRINGVWIRCTSCGGMCPVEKLRGTRPASGQRRFLIATDQNGQSELLRRQSSAPAGIGLGS